MQKVLAATASLLARGLPVDLLTTAQIAGEAQVSVGALYRFFPDKQAIVDAIALRHMEAFQEALTGRLVLAFPADAPAFLAAIIDAFAEYLDRHPDFRTVAFGTPHTTARTVSRTTRDAYAASGEVLDVIRSVLAEAYAIDLTDNFNLRLRLAIETGDRLLAYAFDHPAERPAIIAETKRILSATLFG